MTYTYAILDISEAAYAEIRAKLEAAGYADAFHHEDKEEVIDMHGIAVRSVAPVGMTLESGRPCGCDPGLMKAGRVVGYKCEAHRDA